MSEAAANSARRRLTVPGAAVALGTLAAVACAPVALAETQGGRRLMTPEQASACVKSGGVVTPSGLLNNERCIHTFEDGGKACAGGHECASGACLAAAGPAQGVAISGACAANDDIFGCNTYVENGKADRSMCVD